MLAEQIRKKCEQIRETNIDDDDDFGPVKGLIFKGMFFGLWFSGAASHFFGSPHGAPNTPHGCIGYPMDPPGSSQGPTGA